MTENNELPKRRLKLNAGMLSLAVFSLTLGSPGMLAAQGSSVEEPEQLEEFVGFAGEDPMAILPTQPTESVFGLSKSILETPRSVSTVSSEVIDAMGISAVEDLVRVVPGVYTPTRFGIQGAIDIRNTSADTYFRGMKRLNLQGHGRSVLAAMETIEVVKGPPSPIYGMGKIGGYTNFIPKSGRSKVGAYLEDSEGFVQGIIDSYGKREVSVGAGGPMSLFGKSGGYYVYGLLENSDTYINDVYVDQEILQGAITLDNAIGDFRLDAGFNYQLSGTAGALMNRVTQELIDDGRYIAGSALVNLDLNGNGKVGYLEYQQASPVMGNLATRNEPLRQQFDWPKDANGNLLPLGSFPSVAGIPESLYNYLLANPSADPGGHLTAQGPGGPQPRSGWLPIGFALDPRSVEVRDANYRNPGAFERELEAKFLVGFFDLTNDSNPDFTIKNQVFYDMMDQYKLSEQPGGGKQDVMVFEEKFTVTKRLIDLPDWVAINTLVSVNYRRTESTGHRYGGDFGSNRNDTTNWNGSLLPTETFVNSFENPDLNNDGAPWTSRYDSMFWETGIGGMLDIELFDNTSLILGGRYDYSEARMIDKAGTFNPTTGTTGNPGAFRTSDRRADGSDTGASYSISLNHSFPGGIVPYVTIAESSLTLDTNNNRMARGVIDDGHIGSAYLHEAGIKASLLKDRLFLSVAAYEQSRTAVREDDDSVLGAEVSQTVTKGVETEIRYVATPTLSFSGYVLFQETTFKFNRGGTILVDARTLGFQDVLDSSGNVVFPAEAFLYGGRAFLVLPQDVPEYEEVQGRPDPQIGFNAMYKGKNGWGATFSGNYFPSHYSGRLKLIELPSSLVLNLGISYSIGDWRIKGDIYNLTNERYFRARTGDTLSDALVSAMPERRYQLTITRSF